MRRITIQRELPLILGGLRGARRLAASCKRKTKISIFVQHAQLSFSAAAACLAFAMLRRAACSAPSRPCAVARPAPLMRSAILRSSFCRPLIPFRAVCSLLHVLCAQINTSQSSTAPEAAAAIVELASKIPKQRKRKPATPIVEMDPNLPATPMSPASLQAMIDYEEEQAVFPDPVKNPLGKGAVTLPVMDWNVRGSSVCYTRVLTLLLKGVNKGTIAASSYIFGAPPRQDVIHTYIFAVAREFDVGFFRVVNYILAMRRTGTASTKGRSEVRGGGKKPWKQKKTGRARVGA